jgi:hypothetical protein
MAKCVKRELLSGSKNCDYCGKSIKKNTKAYTKKSMFSDAWYCGTSCVVKSGNEVDNSLLGKLF